MANEEAEKRIGQATQEAQRRKDANEFLQGLTPNDDLIKPVYHPEAFVLRNKLAAAAKRGDLPKTNCRHPLKMIEGYVDFDVNAQRTDKPVNLFECGVCHSLLWLRDAWGSDVGDG